MCTPFGERDILVYFYSIFIRFVRWWLCRKPIIIITQLWWVRVSSELIKIQFIHDFFQISWQLYFLTRNHKKKLQNENEQSNTFPIHIHILNACVLKYRHCSSKLVIMNTRNWWNSTKIVLDKCGTTKNCSWMFWWMYILHSYTELGLQNIYLF